MVYTSKVIDIQAISRTPRYFIEESLILLGDILNRIIILTAQSN